MSIMDKESIKEIVNIKNPEKIVSNIFGLSIFKKERDAKILFERFGLNGSEKKTLDQIGKTLGVTRERVRQIEKNALLKIKNHKESKHYIESLNEEITKFFKGTGFFHSEKELAKKLLNKTNPTEQEEKDVFFIVNLNDHLRYIKENPLHNGIWAVKEIKGTDLTETLKRTILELEEQTNLLEEVSLKAKTARDLSNISFQNLLVASKLTIKVGSKWGLKSWRSINPKSIYDKILVILNELGEPQHYGKITLHLNNRYSKKITVKAVHNELIKNQKFVLIGRGIYALKEWGYNKGTVSEVIVEILKEAGKPLHKNEIIRLVKEKRMVKEATIIINLQKFNRVGKAIYSL